MLMLKVKRVTFYSNIWNCLTKGTYLPNTKDVSLTVGQVRSHGTGKCQKCEHTRYNLNCLLIETHYLNTKALSHIV